MNEDHGTAFDIRTGESGSIHGEQSGEVYEYANAFKRTRGEGIRAS